jgi:hypothetical protein
MKKLWEILLWLITLSTLFLFVGAGYYLASETYCFWKYGIEKSALVGALDHTHGSAKGGTTFFYTLQIGDERITQGFRVQLPEGEKIAILALPNKVTPGTKNSSLFEIFSKSFGGDFIALIIIGMIASMIVGALVLLFALAKPKRKFTNG